VVKTWNRLWACSRAARTYCRCMRTLVALLLHRLGYEIRRIEREPPAAAPPVAPAEAVLHFDTALADFPTSLRQVATPRASAAQLIVEGWRSIPHSYAVVNQWQLISMATRDDVAVRMVDIPFQRRSWKAQDGLFDPEAQAILDRVERADPEDAADVTLRIFFPYDFEPSRSRLTAVFGTCEAQGILRRQLADFRAFDRLKRRPPPQEVRAVTPSTWSAEGFYRAGFRPEQVLVVPHGVDVATFQPHPQLRPAARKAIGAAEHEFVFLSLGAMSGNKGIDLLLRAFGQVLRRHPAALLVLKGLDSVYASKTFLAKSLERVDAAERERVLARTRYFGGALSFREMAVLYQAADAYVSPYRAEGFNIPVLEAAACGLPVICTAGGATDDFVNDSFARRIEAKKRQLRGDDDQEVAQLEPRIEHLVALMTEAVDDAGWRAQAAAAGPRHVAARFTWDQVVDRLVRGLTDKK
jgi:glycosyltransferase involved in cell wall biosynthesis